MRIETIEAALGLTCTPAQVIEQEVEIVEVPLAAPSPKLHRNENVRRRNPNNEIALSQQLGSAMRVVVVRREHADVCIEPSRRPTAFLRDVGNDAVDNAGLEHQRVDVSGRATITDDKFHCGSACDTDSRSDTRSVSPIDKFDKGTPYVVAVEENLHTLSSSACPTRTP